MRYKILYIRRDGRLFVQLHPEDLNYGAGDQFLLYIGAKTRITGVVLGTTKTGVVLDNWNVSAWEV